PAASRPALRSSLAVPPASGRSLWRGDPRYSRYCRSHTGSWPSSSTRQDNFRCAGCRWAGCRRGLLLSCRMGRTSIVNDVSAPVASSVTPNSVTIEKWVYGGEALARLSGAGGNDGRVVLAPFVLPGETVRLEVDDGIHADLVEVLTASSERVAPPCPLFTRC